MIKPAAKLTKLSRKELLLIRDKKIREDFSHHTSSKHLDSSFVVHEILQLKYFLEADLIWRIVRGTYRRSYHILPPQKDALTGNPTLFAR
jgi:hypothetical protein